MLLQFSFQHFYDFNNKFRNDQNDLQLISSQIKDVAYSKELEQEIHNNENMNCDMYFPQLSVQQMYNLNNKFRNENHDVTVNTSSPFFIQPSYLNSNNDIKLLDIDSKETEDLELKTGFNFSSW
ncbi:hypothetical protein GLOIN_2v1878501 [Rhizophagus irregularis DAOM 181602=DAOM 197198]|nr:hypothetical protein GLOIN_2v1878501 [Rhizophagus irregularis DAOM 181602=DAOM 197198]CAB5179342.1 unnamed protein product [Rhizophagus irregularis]